MFLPTHLLAHETSNDGVSSLDLYLARRSWKLPLRNKELTDAFIGMQIFGWVGYTLILWTVLLARKTVERQHTWINFALCWLLSSASYVLLFLAGQQDTPHPSFEICLIQASLVYAAPPLTASATLALVVQLWFNVRTIVFKVQSQRQSLRNIMLFTFPYIPATVFFTSVLVYGIQHPSEVKPADHGMFCNIVPSLPGKASAIYVSLVLAVTIGIEFMITTVLYRNWISYTRNKRHSFAMIIRVVLFTFMGFISITVSLVYLMHAKHGAVPNIFMALLPVISVIIFGSQLDVFRVWMFWRRRREPQPLLIQNPAMRPLLTQSMASLSSADSVHSIDSDESFEPPMRTSTFGSLLSLGTTTLMGTKTSPPAATLAARSDSVTRVLLGPPMAARSSAPAAGQGLGRGRSPSDSSSENVPLRASTM